MLSFRKPLGLDYEGDILQIEIGFIPQESFSVINFCLLEITDCTIALIHITILGFVCSIWLRRN